MALWVTGVVIGSRVVLMMKKINRFLKAIMNKHEKLAWRLSIIYTTGALLFIFLKSFSVLQVAFHICLFGIFYLGFKKAKLIFSALGFGWLFFGSMQALYRISTLILPRWKEDGFSVLMGGALIALIFMLTTTYFALRAFVNQMMHRSRTIDN